MTIDYPSIQSKVTQCVKADCPQAQNCLRQLVRQNCTADLEFIQIVNPDAIECTESGCKFFRSTEGVPFGRGFNTYISGLTLPEARGARAVLYDYFRSRMQYNRYRNGDLRLSPARQEEMNLRLAAAGLPTPVVFDAIEYDYE